MRTDEMCQAESGARDALPRSHTAGPQVTAIGPRTHRIDLFMDKGHPSRNSLGAVMA
jgi:hypothetical protein